MPRGETDNRREDIQILRAVCVAGVVLFHLGLAPSGFLGVDVFLTISGYVVMQSLRRRHEEGIRSFYSRRIGRLFPPLLVVMLGVVLVSIFWEPFGPRQIRTGKYVVLSLASVANIGYWAEEASYFALDVKKDLTLHTWSLSLEEQFYLVLPWFFLIGLRRIKLSPVRTIASYQLLISGVALSSLVLFATNFGSANSQFYLLPARAWQLLLGVLVATIGWNRPSWFTFPVITFSIIALLAFGSTSLGAVTSRLVLGLLTATWLCSLPGSERSLVRRGTRVSRQFVAVGDRSYSIYLVHWPVVVVLSDLDLGWPERIGLSLFFIAFLGEIVFRTADIGRKRRHRSFGRGTAFGLAVTLIGAIVLNFQIIPWLAGVNANASAPAWTDSIDGCEFMNSENSISNICTSIDSDSQGRLLLLGDSTAGSLTLVAKSVAESLGLSFAVAVRGACPYLYSGESVVVEQRQAALFGLDSECIDFNRQRARFAKSFKPQVVLIANRSHRYLVREQGELTIGTSKQFADDLRRTLRGPLDLVPLVLIVQSPPEYPEGRWQAQSSSLLRLLARTDRTFVSSDLPEEDEANLILKRVVAEDSRRIRIVDSREPLCTEGVCQASDGFAQFYADDSHLSIRGAQNLKEILLIEISAR